ncbi:hypothetical protein YA0745_12340 [Pseudomonas synxantha]|uniref:Phage tail fiber protein n=1 Tax=Pseudomonas synxantha TaxID=47883 RepID=A0ABS0UCF9_9PSED|nr:hypothetical protein [Pseudomonas synxantha]MBI6563250.1 hypothetical protein [Pseudomonas synxantha]MBI6582054.1 hypothetical protein [Pseudomonas synxantha]MBI6643725.1 hypothetical protein [Pseudomonas synxantha]
MTDQTQRLEIATVRAEIGSNITYRFNNDAIDAGGIPTDSGSIPNLKQVIKSIEDKASISTAIYPTVASGLAATVEGGMFLVASADAGEIYEVWRKVSGVAVDTGKRALSAQAAQAAVSSAQGSAEASEASAVAAQAAAANAAEDFQDIFEADQVERETEFRAFMDASGYESTYLTYGSGVIVLRQTQLVQRSGELYRVLNASDLPLTLTGNWVTDAPKLMAVGDSALRQILAGPDGAKYVFDGDRSIHDALLAVGVSISPGNGVADDMGKVVTALATTSQIKFAQSPNGYDFKSKVSITLTKDTVIDFNGQLSRWTNGQIILKSPTIATGLTLTANVARAATVLPLSSAAGIQRGDLVYITTTIKPSSDWNDTKKDCVLVTSVSGNSVTLADPLNFHYTTADAGLSIRVYRPVRLELRGLNSLLIAADSDPTPYVQIQAEGIHGLSIINPTIRGQMPFNRDLNPYRVGIQTIVCRDVNIVDPTYEAMSYQVGIYGGSRYITETNAKSYYCHHGHADVGDWSSDYKVKGVIGVDNYQTMSTHPAFRAYAEDVEAHNDYGLQNWRCFGGGIRNGTIRSSADDTLELPQYQNAVMNPGYDYLYDDADFYCDNFDFRLPNRITKAVFGVRFGRTVTISSTKVNDIITSFGGRDNVKQLIVGTGNRIGGRSLSTPGTALTLCPARIDFDVPLDARLLSGVYHVDPRLQMVPHSAGRLACRGSVFTGRAAASPLATNLRLHVNAFSTQSQVNILTGKLKLFSTVTHNSSGDFSTQEKHFNFYFAVRDVSALNFPTIAVFTSGLSGQAGEGVVLTIGTPTFAGVSQIGLGDNYIEVPVVLTASGTSPKFSLSYEVEFNVVD